MSNKNKFDIYTDVNGNHEHFLMFMTVEYTVTNQIIKY